jgi:hypothetical protein
MQTVSNYAGIYTKKPLVKKLFDKPAKTSKTPNVVLYAFGNFWRSRFNKNTFAHLPSAKHDYI